MNRFLFLVFTVLGVIFVQLILERYLSIYGASPQLLLLAVVAFGFLHGPLMGESLGFVWGLMTDAMGASLFGMNALVLTVIGYFSGALRRRVASERMAGQLVIAIVATLLYSLLSSLVCSLFDEPKGQVALLSLSLETLLNVIFVSGVFWFVDMWIDFWRLEREHM